MSNENLVMVTKQVGAIALAVAIALGAVPQYEAQGNLRDLVDELRAQRALLCEVVQRQDGVCAGVAK